MEHIRILSCKDVLRKHRKKLIEELEECGLIAEILYQEEILTKRQYQEFMSKNIQIDKVIFLLDCVEQYGIKGYFAFCDTIKELYPWIEKVLISDAEKNGFDNDTNVTSQNHHCFITENILELLPTEKQLLQICQILPSNQWEILAYELSLDTNVIERCKETTKNSLLQAHRMLITWQRLNADNATLGCLVEAFNNLEMTYIFSQIKEIFS